MICLIREDKILQPHTDHVRRIRFMGELEASSNKKKSRVLKDLADLEKYNYAQYKKLRRSIEFALKNKDLKNREHVRKDTKGRDIYEFCGGGGKGNCDFRLFFFLTEEGDIVVCTHLYGKDPNQDKAFKKCEEDKNLYEMANKKKQVICDA